MKDWRHCPYLPNLVEPRSSGPGSPWPSSPSPVCGGWGKRPGFDDEGSRTRLYGSGATRTVTRLFSENWARTPQNGRGGSVTMGPQVVAGRPSCALPDRHGWSHSWNSGSGEQSTPITGGIVGNAGVLSCRSTSPSLRRSGNGGDDGNHGGWRRTTHSHLKNIKCGPPSDYHGQRDPPSSLSARREGTTSGLQRFRSYFGTDSKLWSSSLTLGPSERALYCRMMTRLSDLESRCAAPSRCVGMAVPAPWHRQPWGPELAEWILQRVRDGAVREWCSKLREVIDLPPSSGGDDGWIVGRLLVLVLRMWRHSSELGIPHPGVHIGQFFVQLTRDAWLIWLRDSTSPKVIVVPLTTTILERGVGPVGNVRIPPDIWKALVPGNFGEVSRRSFSSVAPVTGQSAVLARALVQQGVLRTCFADGLGPNGSLFAIPKNSEKASCICNMVLFNKAQGCDSPPLRLPSVELVAFLQIVHWNVHLDFVPAGCAGVVGDNVMFLLHQMASLKADPPCVGEEPVLCACHIDLSNCFWSRKTPVEFTDAFRVSVDGVLYSFDCLPFGWTHSPAICQAVMVRLVQSARVQGVLVLVYLDDVFIIGYGRKWISMQAGVVASRLREEGAIVSPKSTLEAAVGLAWIGKFFDFQAATVSTARGNWQDLVARWWQLAVGPCTRRRLLRFLGRLLWFVRPNWGVLPFVAPVWAHILWQPQWLVDAPLRLLHTLAGLLPWGLMAWRPLVFFKKPRDWAEYIFFDGACDERTWRMALWGYTMEGRSGIVHEVLCNQQIAEFAALEYAVHFVSALRWDRVGLVGDNFSVLQSFAAGKASVGLRVQNRILRRLVYACTRSRRSWYLCWVPGECNPADPFSRIQSGWRGDYAAAQEEATRRLRLAMGGPTVLVQHVWTLELPVIKQLQGHVGMKVRKPA